jgi:cytochrome c peroxidase
MRRPNARPHLVLSRDSVLSSGLVLSLGLLAGCGDGVTAPATESGPDLPWARDSLGAVPEPADNPSTEAKVSLGRLLFYDPVLSRDGEVACATCHSEIWGMGDGLPLSVGVDGVGPVGPGRTGPNVTTRNASTLWNVGYRETLFWDGRSNTLEEQALLPIENEVEMDRDLDELVEDLRAIAGYQDLFAAAFPEADEPITSDHLAMALAAFERSFVTTLAPYDRYARGDEGALSDTAIDGMWLFADAGCADCHQPPRFETARFANRGVDDDDEGRAAITGDATDAGAFLVPTLRNLRETGPYFHDGSVIELEEAVAYEVARSDASLGASEANAIATFIRKGLMDRSHEPDRPEEVPSGLEVPLDGFRIPR